MDVFSLLKFWRNAGVGDPINAGDFDFTDDEGSFFDLVFTSPSSRLEHNVIGAFHSDQCSKSSHSTYSSNNKKRKVLPPDTRTPRSPFRVLMLGFQNTKAKSHKKEIEEVTIGSLLNGSEKVLDDDQMPSKRFSKDVIHRYLNLIKPLYSRRSNEKVRLHEQSSFHAIAPRKEEKPSVFKDVCKHLGKSRSSSSSVVKPARSPAARRDDSALQQQDGIQSAILHCKKSYNSPSQGCHVLSRSGSAPSQGPRISIDEQKRSSI